MHTLETSFQPESVVPADAPLAAAAWMAQTWGFAMPPVPEIHAEALREFRVGALYGTDAETARLVASSHLEVFLAGGRWPRPGLAFGFETHGRFGVWFYLLVGGRRLLCVELRVRLDEERALKSGLALVTAANRMIERHLSDEVDLARYLNPEPPAPGATHHVTLYSNRKGIDIETVSTWSEEDGLSDERRSDDIFVPFRRPEGPVPNEIILRV